MAIDKESTKIQGKFDDLLRYIKLVENETESTKNLVQVLTQKIEKAYAAIDEIEHMIEDEANSFSSAVKKAFSSLLLEAKDHLERGSEFTECALDDLNDSCSKLASSSKSIRSAEKKFNK